MVKTSLLGHLVPGRRLYLKFPSLFTLAFNKEILVVDAWEASREEGNWTSRSSKPSNDWEVGEVQNLLHLI